MCGVQQMLPVSQQTPLPHTTYAYREQYTSHMYRLPSSIQKSTFISHTPKMSHSPRLSDLQSYCDDLQLWMSCQSESPKTKHTGCAASTTKTPPTSTLSRQKSGVEAIQSNGWTSNIDNLQWHVICHYTCVHMSHVFLYMQLIINFFFLSYFCLRKSN